MEEKELIEYILKDEGRNAGLRITTTLNILATAMIKKGWFTEEEFNEAVEDGLEKTAKIDLEKLSKEQRELLETQAKFSKDGLFGRLDGLFGRFF